MKTYSLVSITASLGFIALSIQCYLSVTRKLAQGFSLLYATNHFFSFFTILTNLTVAVLLASYILFPDSKLTRWFKKTTNSAAIGVYILIVGIIYYALLLKSDTQYGLGYVATHILHGYIPLAYLALWFFKFRNGDLKFKDSVKWLLFPIIYFVYLLIRGVFLGVYPYFFMNVSQYGYSQVLLFSLGILTVFLLVGSLLVMLDQKIVLSSKTKIKLQNNEEQ